MTNQTPQDRIVRSTFVTGMLIGSAVGAAAALWVASRRGTDARMYLIERASDGLDRANAAADKGRQFIARGRELVQSANELVAEGREAVLHAIAEGREVSRHVKTQLGASRS